MVTDGPNRNQFGPNNSNSWSHLTLFSHPINGLYHNVSPCHFSNRIHVSLIIYSQIYFWSGDGLPGPPFCDGSDLDSYTVMLCRPVGRLPHHCVCSIGNKVEGSDWKKKMGVEPWDRETVNTSSDWCRAVHVTKPGIKMSARCFSTTEKSTIFANFAALVCFSEHQYVSLECKIYMDFNGSSGNGEYYAYTETTAPISADCFTCHQIYEQRPVSKPVKTHSFETGMPV